MKADDLIKQIEQKGWFFVRQNGSHQIFKYKDFPNNVSIPNHGKKDIPKGTLNGILKDAGLK